jgi:hypothetical protein
MADMIGERPLRDRTNHIFIRWCGVAKAKGFEIDHRETKPPEAIVDLGIHDAETGVLHTINGRPIRSVALRDKEADIEVTTKLQHSLNRLSINVRSSGTSKPEARAFVASQLNRKTTVVHNAFHS